MKFLFAKKEYMTEIFTTGGEVTPVTVLSIPAHEIARTKNNDTDGYQAFQVGIGTRKGKNVAKAQRKDDGSAYEKIREVKSESLDEPSLSADVFSEGDVVEVSGITKSKGFQGVVKRHNFAGGRRTHGQKHSEREPGSIGAGGVQRVLKGLRMAGRMGGDKVTVKNLIVVKVDSDNNLIFVKGAVPGRRGTLLSVVSK